MARELSVKPVTLLENVIMTTIEDDAQDLSVLSFMARGTYQMLEHVSRQEIFSYPVMTVLDGLNGISHRIVLYRQPPTSTVGLPFVGFISKKVVSPDANIVEILTGVDQQMVRSLVQHTDLLSYSSLQLLDGNWCNLVVFRQPQVREAILGMATHQYAAYELAPKYYQWIRLHDGMLAEGPDLGTLSLRLTKYYTFFDTASRPLVQTRQYEEFAAVQDVVLS